MKLLEKILLAHDFSKSSENVVETAIGLAKAFQSQLLLIHVLPDDILNEKAKSLLNETAIKKLKGTIEKINNRGVKVGEPILKFGSPYDNIVYTSESTNTNLILIGSGESTSDEKFQLGITAKKIIQKSEKPVLVVKEGVPLKIKKILCPVDFSLTSKRALKNAITLAHKFKAELTVLSICELQRLSWLASEKDRKKEIDNRLAHHNDNFNKFLDGFNLLGLNWSQEIRQGDPAEEILKTISEKMVDLLVIGTTGKTGLNRLIIGSVAEKVVREVPCSFLMLKSTDIINLQLTTDIRDLENHYKTARQLMEGGFFEEAINEFQICLSINNMHIASYLGIAKVYEILNDSKRAKIYRDNAREIMDKVWDKQIETEARKSYNK